MRRLNVRWEVTRRAVPIASTGQPAACHPHLCNDRRSDTWTKGTESVRICKSKAHIAPSDHIEPMPFMSQHHNRTHKEEDAQSVEQRDDEEDAAHSAQQPTQPSPARSCRQPTKDNYPENGQNQHTNVCIAHGLSVHHD
eukprot:1351915-Prymnesium_polylepis.1